MHFGSLFLIGSFSSLCPQMLLDNLPNATPSRHRQPSVGLRVSGFPEVLEGAIWEKGAVGLSTHVASKAFPQGAGSEYPEIFPRLGGRRPFS